MSGALSLFHFPYKMYIDNYRYEKKKKKTLCDYRLYIVPPWPLLKKIKTISLLNFAHGKVIPKNHFCKFYHS
jgi:hypothetical protein